MRFQNQSVELFKDADTWTYQVGKNFWATLTKTGVILLIS